MELYARGHKAQGGGHTNQGSDKARVTAGASGSTRRHPDIDGLRTCIRHRACNGARACASRTQLLALGGRRAQVRLRLGQIGHGGARRPGEDPARQQ